MAYRQSDNTSKDISDFFEAPVRKEQNQKATRQVQHPLVPTQRRHIKEAPTF